LGSLLPEANFTEFGDADFGPAAQSLRAISEGLESQRTKMALRHAFAGAETPVFLGFAFHPMNIAALAPNERYSDCRVIGTCIGGTEENLETIKIDLGRKYFAGRAEIERRNQKPEI